MTRYAHDTGKATDRDQCRHKYTRGPKHPGPECTLDLGLVSHGDGHSQTMEMATDVATATTTVIAAATATAMTTSVSRSVASEVATDTVMAITAEADVPWRRPWPMTVTAPGRRARLSNRQQNLKTFTFSEIDVV